MRLHAWALAVAVLALAGGAAAGAGDTERPAPPVDQLVLAETVAAPGATVRLPVRLIDRPGTPLGADRPFGAGIQAFSLRVRALPEGAITSMTLRRSGAAAERTPHFESTPPAPGGAALLVSFEEGREPLLSFSAQRGTIIAEIEARLAAGLAPGTRIDLRLDPTVSVLGNQAGTIEENAANGTLRLRDGAIRIDGPWRPGADSD